MDRVLDVCPDFLACVVAEFDPRDTQRVFVVLRHLDEDRPAHDIAMSDTLDNLLTSFSHFLPEHPSK